MTAFTILPDPTIQYQEQIFTIQVGSEAKSIAFRLRYLSETDRWYFSFYDAQTGAPYCMYVPLVASYDYPNDLLAPFACKNLGMLFCIPNYENPSTEDPAKDSLSEFTLIWSDGSGEE